jgi:hypothetical protein
MQRDGVTDSDFLDLLEQFRILHRHGVAHGDAHGKNIGFFPKNGSAVALRDRGGFVIVDPTWVVVSPLSDLFEPVPPEDTAVVEALRSATKQGGPTIERPDAYELSKVISDLGDDAAMSAFLTKRSVAPTRSTVARALFYVDEHNKVVRKMGNDRSRLAFALEKVIPKSDDERRKWSFLLAP